MRISDWSSDVCSSDLSNTPAATGGGSQSRAIRTTTADGSRRLVGTGFLRSSVSACHRKGKSRRRYGSTRTRYRRGDAGASRGSRVGGAARDDVDRVRRLPLEQMLQEAVALALDRGRFAGVDRLPEGRVLAQPLALLLRVDDDARLGIVLPEQEIGRAHV